MKPVHRLIHFVQEKLGLSVLIVLLSVITVTAIKPGFYLIGWDNYSSYFEPGINLFRTLFATWRDYRGIGVASDSEVVDIFRQLFSFAFSFLVPKTMLDQLYFLFSLWAGVLGMYILTRSIILRHTVKQNIDGFIDFASAASAGFYLFNLNTLATFYFPILPYITRFGSLPWVLWAWMELVNRPTWTARFALLCLSIFFMSTGSYLTATVFLTTLFTILIISLFSGSLKRVTLVMLLFLGINSFWLFPFANYTRGKSATIRLAPVFVDTNELQLNQSKEAYSLVNTLLLMPNFFETAFTDMETRSPRRFHELATLAKRPEYQFALSFFPILALVGACIVIIMSLRHRKMRPALWIPCTLILYGLLSMKEYSPLGRFYQLLTAIPYFSVLFRFGDTKFHPYLAFAGSLSTGIGVYYIFLWVKRFRASIHGVVAVLVFSIIAIPTLFVFRSYFQGNLIGFFMYNRLPDAYRRIASVINQDSSYGRVLHLPFDKDAYWKSYSWGPIGSSFLNFLLDKPLLDKTFEPASLEQSSLFAELANSLEDASTIAEKDRIDVRADALYRFLTDTAVKYVIVDHTVTPEVVTRGIRYWGKFNLFDSIALADHLKERGLLELVGTYPVDLAAIGMYPGSYGAGSGDIQSIQLFHVLPDMRVVSFPENVTMIDGRLDRQSRAVQSFLSPQESFMEDSNNPAVMYPFLRRDVSVKDYGSSLSLVFPLGKTQQGLYRFTSPEGATSSIVEVAASRTGSVTVFRLYQIDAPGVAGQRLKRLMKEVSVPQTILGKADGIQTPREAYVANWHILGSDPLGPARLVVGDVIVPVPSSIAAVETTIATVLVRGRTVPVSVVVRSDRMPLTLDRFQLTDNPNCFGDKLSGYENELFQANGMTLRSVNGSTCVISALNASRDTKGTAHVEVGLEIEGKSEDLDGVSAGASFTDRFLYGAANAFAKPSTLIACIKTGAADTCANIHQAIRIPKQRSILVFPAERVIGGASSLSLQLALKNIGFQSQSLTIHQAFVDEFRSVLQDTFTLFPTFQNFDINLDNSGSIQIDIPKVLSPSSYFYNSYSDAFLVSNRPCESIPSGYRTSRVTLEGRWLSMISNCTNDTLQTLPFSGSNLYLWNVAYRLFSGEFPKFVLQDSFAQHRNEYLSLYQGYPDIPGFKPLQYADSPMLGKFDKEIEVAMTGGSAQHATTYIYPKPELGDEREKSFTLTQHAGNHGIYALDGFSVIALPEYWARLSLMPTEGSRRSFVPPLGYTVKRMLPSLWQVEVTNTARSDSYLLEFRQGYDRQWGIYDSLWGALFGRSLAQSIRCQGYANCFVVSAKEGMKTHYLFYAPEKLSLLGWLGTVATVAAFVIVLRSRSRCSS